MIKCDCVNDVSSNEQWWEAGNCLADQIHKKQLKLKSIQTLIETAAFMTDVKQADEQHNNNDD